MFENKFQIPVICDNLQIYNPNNNYGAMNQNSFVEYVKDILHPFGDIRAKSMFGGYGIYCNDLFFALIAGGELYFKGDKGQASEFFKESGSEPFIYEGGDKKVTMNYWKVPEDVLEDNDSLSKWFDLSYNLAINSKRKKK